MCKNIEGYLSLLRRELAGADPATIQDALADAEEHLTAALAYSSTADSTGTNQLDAIIEEYGSPSEVAAAYRIIERRLKPPLAVPPGFYERSLASRFLSVVYDPRAWGALLYLLTSIITGNIYFAYAVVGLTLSVELLILIIGLPVVWLFLKSVRGVALMEGRIVESLLGVRMPRRPTFSQQNLKWLDQLKLLVKDKRSWSIIGYMILKLPLGVVYFSVTITLFALSLELMALPILQLVFDLPFITTGSRSYYLPINMMPLLVLLGLALFIVLMHLARAMGRMHGKLAKAMLVGK